MTVVNPAHLTRCGLPGIDSVPFGMHACHFYANRDQLIAALVPYFVAGLHSNERCLWVTAPPLPAREAVQALRGAWVGVDNAIEAGALRIVDFDQWYANSAGLKGLDVVQSWLDEEERALAAGYDGLRIAGNTRFLEPGDWANFMEYERAVTARVNGRRIVALCSYALAQRNDQEMIDIMQAHHCAFERADANWRVVTVPGFPTGLPGQVKTSTSECSMSPVHPVASNAEADSFMALAGLDQAAMDALPEAVYLCAADGSVVRFNQKAVELWGRTPKSGDPQERFCGSFRLYHTDGTSLPRDQCPVAVALQTGESFRNKEVVVEQPGGQRLTVLVNIVALKDRQGRVNGAINCFRDITDRKQAEDRQRRLTEELDHRLKNTLATVHSLAANTARNATSIEEFTARFEARLLALSRAHTLLGRSQWTGARLRDLLAQQFEAFGGEDNARVRLKGGDVDLPPQLALALSIMFHELMTNAAKYGPLSVASGKISVEWDLLSGSEGDRKLLLRWVETDGPPVRAPQRKGFGTRLIERMIRDELKGKADLLFEPPGLQLSASIPLPN